MSAWPAVDASGTYTEIFFPQVSSPTGPVATVTWPRYRLDQLCVANPSATVTGLSLSTPGSYDWQWYGDSDVYKLLTFNNLAQGLSSAPFPVRAISLPTAPLPRSGAAGVTYLGCASLTQGVCQFGVSWEEPVQDGAVGPAGRASLIHAYIISVVVGADCTLDGVGRPAAPSSTPR